jgi:hypothetical protein
MKGTVSAVPFFLAWENQSVVIPSAVLSREESASRLHRAGNRIENADSG